MIFVTVGTQATGFVRCLREVESLIDKFNIKEEIIAQIGYTKFVTSKYRTIRFLGEEEYSGLIRSADVIITHAGSGAIFKSIKAGKKIIAMARLHDYNEMVDNHQAELVKKLSEEGYIIDGSKSLLEAWPKLKNFTPRQNDFECKIIPVVDNWINTWINETI